MQIICVSRGSYSRGKELAEQLAKKLGYQCMGREDVLEAAVRAGIPVEKLERALTKSKTLPENLMLEKDHYQALATVMLCERALKNNLVYHGHTGHLLLPGLSHVLKVRVVTALDYRIRTVMQRFNLTVDKAREYIERVEEERRRWVRQYYNVEWDEISLYDVVLNLEQLGTDNAASVLCAMAQLPDFQVTPASHQEMQNLYLASRARLKLAEDEKTHFAHLKVHADQGTVSVIYQPQQADVVQYIPAVLQGLEGIREIICARAQTSILWIQERYDPQAEAFEQLIQIAKKWDAAIELVQFLPTEMDIMPPAETKKASVPELAPEGDRVGEAISPKAVSDKARTVQDDGGLQATAEALIVLGRAGGMHTVQGNQKSLLGAVDRLLDYSLIVIGDVFLSKGHSARTRMRRQLENFLGDKLKCPVVTSEELGTQYLFGKRHLMKMLLCAVLTFVIYFLVFSHQVTILRFLTAEGTESRMLAVIAVVTLVPLIAYLYGSTARLLLKWVRME